MLIHLRNSEKKLVIKDILDIDFDMFVEPENDGYIVRVNSMYQLNEKFASEQDAEQRMIQVADARNGIEEELKNY